MNGAMIGVVLAVIFGLPVAIWAVFACSRDQHEYARHYTDRGYSSEISGERPIADSIFPEDVQEQQLMETWPSITHQLADLENQHSQIADDEPRGARDELL